jgi:WD40 repeat protein
MNIIKPDIIWSPFNDDDFILVTNSIVLYKITSFKNRNNNKFELIGTIDKYQSEKIVAWYPDIDIAYPTIAIHETNQNKIHLYSFMSSDSGSVDNDLTILELDTDRKSYKLQWNATKSNYLGASFEKVTGASSVLIWDAFRSTNPLYELAEFNCCYSFEWLPDNSDILFTASNDKTISIYDLRTGTMPCQRITSEYTKGFTIDPKNTTRAVSFDNNKIAIWDLRNLSNQTIPIDYLEEEYPIKKLQFCPSRPNRLGNHYHFMVFFSNNF